MFELCVSCVLVARREVNWAAECVCATEFQLFGSHNSTLVVILPATRPYSTLMRAVFLSHNTQYNVSTDKHDISLFLCCFFFSAEAKHRTWILLAKTQLRERERAEIYSISKTYYQRNKARKTRCIRNVRHSHNDQRAPSSPLQQTSLCLVNRASFHITSFIHPSPILSVGRGHWESFCRRRSEGGGCNKSEILWATLIVVELLIRNKLEKFNMKISWSHIFRVSSSLSYRAEWVEQRARGGGGVFIKLINDNWFRIFSSYHRSKLE